MRYIILLLLITLSLSCHYSCFDALSCTTEDYYSCTACGLNRGNGGVPIGGMCYCNNDSDEDTNGVCQSSQSFNLMSKVLIATFIALTLFIALIAIFLKGMKYFLYKTIDDVQELSLIVFINLYFPQQFDLLLSRLYGFNISSYTFQNMAEGSLFYIMPDSTVVSATGENIAGKYILLRKSANFFANQFTWMIVFVSILITAIIIRFVRNYLKKRRDFDVIKKQIQGPPKQANLTENQSQWNDGQWLEVKRKQKQPQTLSLYWFINRLYNIIWFNFFIVFFYFSLIEININIFTQIANLTFSSSFATTGAFFSAVFLGIEIVLLVLLFLKSKEQMIKPEWMRDYSFTPTIYFVRTNFKTITKYFWFISCLKKVLIALMLTTLYQNPLQAIIGVSIVHAAYLSFAIYCQPFERKYIRAHFYITEAAKMFMFLSLLNFTSQYANFVSLIDLTVIFYLILTFIFGMHLAFLLIAICMEWSVYKHFFLKKFYKDSYEEIEKVKVGYRSNDKLFIYIKE